MNVLFMHVMWNVGKEEKIRRIWCTSLSRLRRVWRGAGSLRYLTYSVLLYILCNRLFSRLEPVTSRLQNSNLISFSKNHVQCMEKKRTTSQDRGLGGKGQLMDGPKLTLMLAGRMSKGEQPWLQSYGTVKEMR